MSSVFALLIRVESSRWVKEELGRRLLLILTQHDKQN